MFSLEIPLQVQQDTLNRFFKINQRWHKKMVAAREIIDYSGYNSAMQKDFSERKGKLAELNRSFDLRFWQSQSAAERFQAAWELVQHAWKVKGNDVRQLRLHRSVESFQRQKR